MSFCPDLEDTSGLVLSDDNLSGVVALGLFAIKSQLKVCNSSMCHIAVHDVL